jgi:hypothetical protein
MWIKLPSYKSKYLSSPISDAYLRIKKNQKNEQVIEIDMIRKNLIVPIEVFSSYDDRMIEGTLPMETITLYGVYNPPEEIPNIQVWSGEVYDSFDVIFPKWTMVDLHNANGTVSEAIYDYLKSQSNFLGIDISVWDDQSPM